MGEGPFRRGDKVRASTMRPCPFCDGTFAVAEEDGRPCGLIHSLPMCPTFEEKDVLTFVQMVNRFYLQRHSPSDA